MGKDEVGWNICAECAQAKGWVFPKWPVTCTFGLCVTCNEEDKTLIPVVDFSINGEEPIWD